MKDSHELTWSKRKDNDDLFKDEYVESAFELFCSVSLVLPLETKTNRTCFKTKQKTKPKQTKNQTTNKQTNKIKKITRANPSAGVKWCCFNVFRALKFYTPKDPVHTVDALYTELMYL